MFFLVLTPPTPIPKSRKFTKKFNLNWFSKMKLIFIDSFIYWFIYSLIHSFIHSPFMNSIKFGALWWPTLTLRETDLTGRWWNVKKMTKKSIASSNNNQLENCSGPTKSAWRNICTWTKTPLWFPNGGTKCNQ